MLNIATALASADPAPPAGPESDYEIVRRAIEFMTERWREQPSLDRLAAHVGMNPLALQKLFTRWCGLSPKAFIQAHTLDRARALLADDASILDTSYEVGLSGPGRLHDLFVTHEAMSPGAYKARGEGVVIRWGFHNSPFGHALIMITDRGLAGLAFADLGDERAALLDMQGRFPCADYIEDQAATACYAARIFEPERWRPETPLRLVLIGSDFQVRVWQTLLGVPLGRVATYSQIAEKIDHPKAARAVGAAVGRNPISFVVPCHRILGKSGALTGYHWGLTRKRAILGWEAGVSGRADD
ncbi:bifunctional helix-turn-helix domain-containing protein/methylated-DNA--[protein]-cysteine S-methyltransferase [Kaistia dalseonensis]|uniref:AraC family transcriptional regulator of adaptative response/methylated-DNA-[protein]-cysteine methyltransferase n=1 Tax=Kaistia dalseonensis TaxID=410840 RepID=A0ABU0H6E0_9HYPH|nr:bifunctional helix-turn-helix domain-containing protein/methylated-DNA--[protein]-cysteine S-methyltransferase [Kaistia dalseonensis]MCX5495011.1 bifunctional helix-turn-helix domain-containing protein/methylated-DNA--[protein]-cysteine S-methyltransferase [Kaistia dalseonensis]MDQ0437592.1 AraC family transcriptional regulator of adaptative response/methylated-DNA-[protein]-cysteine methyltransferase [Kaistia dalseonensis]